MTFAVTEPLGFASEWLPFQTAKRHGHGFIGYPKGRNFERALGPSCFVYFSLTGTVSTSPNLAKEEARSVTMSGLFCYIKIILTHWDFIYFTKFS